MRVFLSYRRDDVGGYAGRLHDVLAQRLGANSVFHDVSTIAPGADFVESIDSELVRSDAVLVVIGPGWASAATATGDVRLQQPNDFVRREVARALQRGLPVVPVLVGGAALPEPSELPDDMRDLVRRQVVTLHNATWREDVDGLLRSLRGEVATGTPNRRRTLAVAVAIVAALTVAAIGFWRLSAADGDDDADDPSVEPCAPAAGDDWVPVSVAADAGGEVPVDGGSLAFVARQLTVRQDGSAEWTVLLNSSMENDTEEDVGHFDYFYDAIVVGGHAFRVSCFSADDETLIPGTVGRATVGFEVTCPPTGYMELVLEDQLDRIDLTDAETPSAC